MLSNKILPKGVESFNIINSFDTDLAQYFLNRTDSLKLTEVSSTYKKEVERINTHFNKFNEKGELDTLEEDFNDLLNTASQLSYKSGFDDGIRFIIQALLIR